MSCRIIVRVFRLLHAALVFGCSGWIPTAHAHDAQIAVAANFVTTAQELVADYQRVSGQTLGLSSASTGKLYAQIRNGAPFDLLLSADRATPERLVREDLALGDSLQDYAIGRLVLWAPGQDIRAAGEHVLREGEITRLAIANPQLAPYGEAAREVLEHVGRWQSLQPRIVRGENVGQAAQFVASGAAPFGLVPRSLVLDRDVDAIWLVPADWHRPLLQAAVLLEHGHDNATARDFLAYLHSEAARRVILAHGYDPVP